MAQKSLIRSGSGLLSNSFFNDFLRPWGEWSGESAVEPKFTMPAVNISEKDKSYKVSLAAPGLAKDDFNIEIHGNVMTISAEKEASMEDKDENYSRCEYNYSSFSRSFTLPEEVNQDAIEAEYKDGVLNLTVPKKEATQPSPMKVKVK